MLREHARIVANLMMGLDICLLSWSFVGGYCISRLFSVLYPISVYVNLMVPFVIIWSSFLNIFGMYKSFRIKPIYDIIQIIVKTALVGIGIFGIMLYFIKAQYVSRLFVITIFALTVASLSIEKILLMQLFGYIRRHGYNTRNILIVGTGKRAEAFIDNIRSNSHWGLRITGLIDNDPLRLGMEINGYRVIGMLHDIQEIIHNNVIDEVIYLVPRSWLGDIEDTIKMCELEGIKVNIAVDYYDLKISRAMTNDLAGFPVVTFESGPSKVGHIMIKRLFDIFCSSLFIVAFSPLYLAVAILVKSTSHGPVFFKQERLGIKGRKFILYKFRTMEDGAEAKQEGLLSRNEMRGPAFKLKNDPRVTAVGSFLRRSSMDELPQFWNVLKGDMSIVGPRPPIKSEVKRYDNWQRRRLSMRPGITCLWQVRGRSTITDFDEWMKLDLEYIDNWSLWLDAKIFIQTIPAVLSGVGAK